MSKSVLMASHGITGVTGFSNQLMLQARALIEIGYDVYAIHRDYSGEPITFPRDCGVKTAGGRELGGITFLPRGGAQWFEDVFPYYIEKYKPEAVHTLGDIWCYQYIPKIPKKNNWWWLSHLVIDTENMVTFWNESFSKADIAIVPSLSTYNMVKSAGHENTFYIPHGIDTKTFRPATFDEKMLFRKELGIPENAYVIGMVAHNQFRKMINRLLDAFELFVKSNPGNKNAILALHCLPRDASGWDLLQIAKNKGISDRVFFTDKNAKGLADIHVTEEMMRKFYCAMDVHALSTGGEGFGVPIVEAMACGIPNVMTAYTTGKEFLQNENEDGSLVDYCGIAVPYSDVEMHQTGGIWAKINREQMAMAFQYLKDNPNEAKKMGLLGNKRAVERYDSEVVKNKWKELYTNADDILDRLRNTSGDSLKLTPANRFNT